MIDLLRLWRKFIKRQERAGWKNAGIKYWSMMLLHLLAFIVNNKITKLTKWIRELLAKYIDGLERACAEARSA